ncbi:MAG: T9SS type A sorting domain-containing protein [candidate division Zixibacteria bacterium]|nr:T9SS type A sorting domain-containing protein [candidate division Zixibacteria bacterium]
MSAFAGGFGEAQLEFTSFQRCAALSSSRRSQYYVRSAIAEQQYYAVFFDTTVDNQHRGDVDPRPHVPVGLEVHQNTLAWSDKFSQRSIIADWWFKNIGSQPIQRGCIGFVVDPAVFSDLNPDDPMGSGEIMGFLPAVPGIVPGTLDTVNMAWSASKDGDPVNGQWVDYSVRGVAGVRVLRSPSGGPVNFNWWALSEVVDWGPRRIENPDAYMGSMGSPPGDASRYRMMINGETDYDEVYAGIDHLRDGWRAPLSPSFLANAIAAGQIDGVYVLSVGPFADIAPGDSVPFTVALIAGDNFHTDPRNFADRFDPTNPRSYLDHLDFSDLITNARWADWVFDNPGVDTDHDGNRGRAYLVNCQGADSGTCDSVFYKGDGVPDWRGPQAPPGPEFKLVTQPGKAILSWNGAFTELEKDPLSRKRDFEGYRIYAGRFGTDDQLSLVASWDREDYKRLAYQPGTGDWRQISDPQMLGEWQQMLGTAFDPRQYAVPSLNEAYRDSFWDTTWNAQGEIVGVTLRERLSYWAVEAANRANEYTDEGRLETNIIQRVAERDTVVEGEPLIYGVYEVTLGNLQASVPLYFAVTTFDFGDYEKNLDPMESSPANNCQYGQPIYSADVVKDSGIKVSVYPNPYKIAYNDAFGNRTNYFAEGYEGYGHPVMTEYDRRIHFINLPDTATIRIYTLAGDLIREIHHPDRFLTTYSSSVGWDLISRNAQPVTSGIYIYRVDSRLGSQVGKIVIIK